MAPLVRVVICEPFYLVREGLKNALSGIPSYSFELLGEAGDWTSMESFVRTQRPELLLLSDEVLKSKGEGELEKLRRRVPRLRVVLMGEKHDKNLEEMARSGKACGYFWKGAKKETIDKGLSDVLRGCLFVSFEENGGPQKNGKAKVPAKDGDKKSIAREFRLTRREFQVLGLIAQALSNKEIAHRLFISDQTVSVHRKNIMRKLGVSNTAGLIKWAFENDLA